MSTDLSQFALWNADPVMLRSGGLILRYYSACLFLLFVTGEHLPPDVQSALHGRVKSILARG